MDGKKVELSEQSCNNDIPVRTLFLGPVEANMSEQIKVYFEQCGKVNSVEIEQHKDSGIFFALVEFKTDETAAAVLSSSNGMHCIDGCDIQVKAAEPWQQPDHILNALDDDCLRAILLQLTEPDLTNAANVCVRFNEQAKSVFSSEFRTLDLTECSHEEAENSLKTFGSLAQSIDVESKYLTVPDGGYEVEMLSMIAQYCTPLLKELTINGFGFEHQLPDDVKFDAALSKLEILSLNDCYLQNSLGKLVSACGDLKVLHIDSCSQFASANSNWCIPKFDRLEELHFSEMAGLSELFLCRIIASHSTLKVLSMVGMVQSDVDLMEVFGTIVEKLPNLLELEFNVSVYDGHDFTEILRCLGCLRSLKVLKLDLNGRSAGKLSSVLTTNGIPIEHMQLFNGSIDTEAIQGILQMKQLKILGLFEFDGLTDEYMMQLAIGLGGQLEKLHLEGPTAKHLTTIGLKKMLATVQKRPEKNALLIELTGEGGRVKVDELVLLEHRDVFHIDEKNAVVELNYDSDDSTDHDSE